MTEQLNECFWRATSSGSGDPVVASAITGYYTPAQCTNPSVVDGARYRYRAESDDLSQYQSGLAPYDVGTASLLWSDGSAEIYQSSNSGAQVTFSAAPRVTMTSAAQDITDVWVLVESGDVSSPVSTLDIALPAGFVMFRLEIEGYAATDVTAGGCSLGFNASSDGGSTWQQPDGGGFYVAGWQSAPPNVGTVQYSGALMGVVDAGRIDSGLSVSIDIRPGSATSSINVRSHVSGYFASETKAVQLEHTGIGTPSGGQARYDMIRLQVNSDDLSSPPDDGSTIDSIGSWRLLGLR